MQKEINFYQEMASEHRLQEYCRGSVPLYKMKIMIRKKTKHKSLLKSLLQRIPSPPTYLNGGTAHI